jgi:hypothetical protein
VGVEGGRIAENERNYPSVTVSIESKVPAAFSFVRGRKSPKSVTDFMVFIPNNMANILTYILNHLLSPWSRGLPEKLTCPQLIRKFPAFLEL